MSSASLVLDGGRRWNTVEGLWVLAVVLICPLVMGLMMLLMMRGRKKGL